MSDAFLKEESQLNEWRPDVLSVSVFVSFLFLFNRSPVGAVGP